MGDVFEITSEDGSVRITAGCGDSVVLGRNPLTRVKDKSVSKEHLRIEFGSQVRFLQLGSNRSTVDGVSLKKGQTLTLVEPRADIFLYRNDHRFQLMTASSTAPAVHPFRLKTTTAPLKTTSTSSSSTSYSTHSPDAKARAIAKVKAIGGIKNSDDDGKKARKRRLEEGLSPEPLSDPSPPKKKPTLNSWLKLDRDDGDGVTNDSAGDWLDSSTEKLMVFTPSGVVAKPEILGFDVDSTVITTKSGKTFGVDYDDWKILFPNCAKKMEEAIRNGKKICFFTNQAGIERGKVDKNKFQKKVEAIVRSLNIPIQVFVSCGDGFNRKPLPGMWEALEKRFNDSVVVNRDRSLYVGDAAGRPENWKPKTKKDFSSADRLFAINLGVPFQVPEEFFQGIAPPPFSLPDFDPRSLRDQKELIASPKSAKVVAGCQEVVVLVGSPAAGKSTFAKNYLISNSYAHVNRDSLGSWQKCIQAAKEALRAGKSVVVDNTNGDVQTRQRYLNLAKETNVQIRCFVFQVSATMARHMNKFRKMAFPDKTHKDVNDIIIYSHHKNFQEPTLDEGFLEIVRINFVPKFEGVDEKLRRLFFSFLIEK